MTIATAVATPMASAIFEAFKFGMARYDIFDDLRRDILYSILTLILIFWVFPLPLLFPFFPFHLSLACDTMARARTPRT
jgi:hypothetical protein